MRECHLAGKATSPGAISDPARFIPGGIIHDRLDVPRCFDDPLSPLYKSRIMPD
jgi:hypothetical protein